MITETDFLGLDFPRMLRDSGAELPNLKTVVVVSGPTSHGQLTWDEFTSSGVSVRGDEVRARRDAVSGDDISDVMFTSGTTGLPKGVVTTHAKTLWTYTRLAQRLGFVVGDRDLLPLPFFHGFGYKAGWLACFMCGATAYPMAVYDIDEIVRTVERERITILLGPPTLYHSLLALPDLADRDLGSLRVGLAGAASVPVELIRKITERLAFDVVLTGYGLTECNGNASTTRAGDPPEVIARTVGRALDGVEIEVRDLKTGRAVVDSPGEVMIRGYNIMVGYLDDEEATRVAIDKDGWLHSGDIGVIDKDGNLRITDRIKDMFISGGINAYPAEIENTMHSHPDLEQIAVVGVPDSRLGEVGMAFVVPRRGRSTAEPDLIKWCKDRMANYKVPRYVEIVDGLPLNPTGKVLKNELRAAAAARLAPLPRSTSDGTAE
jgi:acyl-CoA synthetase (AMP-forming)/AMP-acid ligase II